MKYKIVKHKKGYTITKYSKVCGSKIGIGSKWQLLKYIFKNL